FAETPGCGMEGVVGAHQIVMGSADWLSAKGVPHGPALSKSHEAASGSTVHVAIDGEYRGWFELAHSLRPATGQLIARLGKEYQLALLSGDNEKDSARFRRLFGNGAPLHFNQSPLDKLGFVRGLQQSGKRVLMVGDGLNDAGALRQSDVGVAVVED